MKDQMYSTISITHVCPVDGTYDEEGIARAIRQQFSSICTKREGFYIDIIDIKIVEARASIKGNLICTARCQIVVYMPGEGQVVSAIVEDCLDQRGIYCVFMDRLKILVPFQKLTSYIFMNGTFKSECEFISQGDSISIVIEKIRYQNGYYRAIGRINK